MFISSYEIRRAHTYLVITPHTDVHTLILSFHLMFIPSYEIMYCCWRADPLDRPDFTQVRELLEKLVEKLPEVSSRENLIYINTSFPEEDAAGAAAGGAGGAGAAELKLDMDPVCCSSPACSRQTMDTSVTTADIHEGGEEEEEAGDEDERYVIVISTVDPLVSGVPPALDTPLLSREGREQAGSDSALSERRTEQASDDTMHLL